MTEDASERNKYYIILFIIELNRSYQVLVMDALAFLRCNVNLFYDIVQYLGWRAIEMYVPTLSIKLPYAGPAWNRTATGISANILEPNGARSLANMVPTTELDMIIL